MAPASSPLLDRTTARATAPRPHHRGDQHGAVGCARPALTFRQAFSALGVLRPDDPPDHVSTTSVAITQPTMGTSSTGPTMATRPPATEPTATAIRALHQ